MFERAYHDRLAIPEGLEGRLWRYAFDGLERRGHRHDELELNLVTHGTGELMLRDRRYPLRRGALVWLFPGQDHILMQTPSFRMWVLEVDPALIARCDRTGWLSPLLERDPPGSFCRALDEATLVALERLMESVSTESEPSLHSVGLAHVVLRAWARFQTAHEGDHATPHPAVMEAMRLLRERTPGEDSLQAIAAEVGLSASRLSHLFAAELDVGFAAMRSKVRLQRFLAIAGAGSGDRNLLDAALEAGFGSYAQFFRVFRQEMGTTPRLWAAGCR